MPSQKLLPLLLQSNLWGERWSSICGSWQLATACKLDNSIFTVWIWSLFSDFHFLIFSNSLLFIFSISESLKLTISYQSYFQSLRFSTSLFSNFQYIQFSNSPFPYFKFLEFSNPPVSSKGAAEVEMERKIFHIDVQLVLLHRPLERGNMRAGK